MIVRTWHCITWKRKQFEPPTPWGNNWCPIRTRRVDSKTDRMGGILMERASYYQWYAPGHRIRQLYRGSTRVVNQVYVYSERHGKQFWSSEYWLERTCNQEVFGRKFQDYALRLMRSQHSGVITWAKRIDNHKKVHANWKLCTHPMSRVVSFSQQRLQWYFSGLGLPFGRPIHVILSLVLLS